MIKEPMGTFTSWLALELARADPDSNLADLATMETKLEANTYETLDQFVHDARLIFNNCRRYNDAGSNCTFANCGRLSDLLPRAPLTDSSVRICAADVKNANKLENYLNEQLKIYVDP